MKKILFLMLSIAAILTSCSQNDEVLSDSSEAQEVKFSLTTDQAQSRADGLRYVMAIYDETGENAVIAETVYDSSTFSLRLEPGKYTCLFWADYGEANYDATDLKNVATKENSADNACKEAFYAKQGITVTNGNVVNVTLHRAVAQITFKETVSLFAGNFSVTYSGYQNFDTSTGIASNAVSVTEDINIATDVKGSQTSPAEICTIFLLANNVKNDLHEFTVKYSTEPEKTISNVPVQANCKTNINGNFGGIPYVTFSAESEQKFTMSFDTGRELFTLGSDEYFEYSVGGSDWTRFTSTVENIAFGGTLGNMRLRGKSNQGTAVRKNEYSAISFGISDVMVDCKGDIRTLIDYDNYETASTANARFCRLFNSNKALKTAPELPATTLTESCYYEMFEGCTSLATAPELPATTLANSCYYEMFEGCTLLTTAPELPATTLTESCYAFMFSRCTSLATAPTLPATTLADNCYGDMFSGCTSLTKAPALPAMTLKNGCYNNMFYGCTSLITAPTLPATTLTPTCYKGMFYGCTSLTTAPVLSAPTLESDCYYFMFYNCSKLSEVKMLATNVSAYNSLGNWLYNAGTEAGSRKLTLANEGIYNTLSANSLLLPDIWKSGQAEIIYK